MHAPRSLKWSCLVTQARARLAADRWPMVQTARATPTTRQWRGKPENGHHQFPRCVWNTAPWDTTHGTLQLLQSGYAALASNAGRRIPHRHRGREGHIPRCAFDMLLLVATTISRDRAVTIPRLGVAERASRGRFPEPRRYAAHRHHRRGTPREVRDALWPGGMPGLRPNAWEE